MKDFLELLKREWEISILCVVVLALLVAGVCALTGGDPEEDGASLAQGMTVRNPTVSTRSICFLKTPDGMGVGEMGSFSLPACVTEEERVAVRPKPPAKPRRKPAVKARPVVKPPPKAAAPPPAAVVLEPKREPVLATLFFGECQTMADGTRVGLFELSLQNNRSNMVLGQGESLHGLTVEGVSDRSVLVRDAKGRRLEPKSGTEGRLWILSW